MATANTNGFRVLPSYFEAIRDLPDAERLILYDAVWDFGFGNSVGELPPLLASIFCLIKPTLEKSMAFEAKQKANGQKGGRPPKPKDNPEETQTKPSETQTKPSETQSDFGGNLDIDIAVAVDSDLAVATDKAAKPKKKFIPPTLGEIEDYIQQRGSGVDAKKFFDFYSCSDWKDSRGNPVKNWKQKLITWERGEQNGYNRTDSRAGSGTGTGGNPAGSRFSIEYDVDGSALDGASAS